MNNNLLILGAGQYGYVAKEIAEAMGCFGKISFLDDQSELAIGKLEEYVQFTMHYRCAIVSIGNADLRLQWIRKLEEACFVVPILVHPQSCVMPSAQLMKGTIVEPMAVIHSNTTVCVGCIVSAGAVINHNCFLGDCCHVDCNAVVPAREVLMAGTKVSCGMVYEKK